MDKEIVVDNEFITVWYYPETKIIHHQFHKFVHGQTFRDALTAGAESLKKNRAQKWLSDDRKNTVVNGKSVET